MPPALRHAIGINCFSQTILNCLYTKTLGYQVHFYQPGRGLHLAQGPTKPLHALLPPQLHLGGLTSILWAISPNGGMSGGRPTTLPCPRSEYVFLRYSSTSHLIIWSDDTLCPVTCFSMYSRKLPSLAWKSAGSSWHTVVRALIERRLRCMER